MATAYRSPFAGPEIDFGRIADIADSYYGAKDAAIKRQALQEDRTFLQGERARQARERETLRNTLAAADKNPDGSINYAGAAERLIRDGMVDPAKSVLGVGSAYRDYTTPKDNLQKVKEGEEIYRINPRTGVAELVAGMSQQNKAQDNILGGMRELHSIPERYGGDKGAFGSAVGPLSGDPNSWAGTLARAKGRVDAYYAQGQKPNAPPTDEVRRAIEGATNTLAASLKPLIRKPGEGSWSDRDQAVLESIVGNLTRVNTVEQFDRELDNVRQRINANFGLQLPAFARKPNTGRAPTAQPNPPAATPRKALGGKTYVKIDGQWYEE